jgi:hypothetical protein
MNNHPVLSNELTNSYIHIKETKPNFCIPCYWMFPVNRKGEFLMPITLEEEILPPVESIASFPFLEDATDAAHKTIHASGAKVAFVHKTLLTSTPPSTFLVTNLYSGFLLQKTLAATFTTSGSPLTFHKEGLM